MKYSIKITMLALLALAGLGTALHYGQGEQTSPVIAWGGVVLIVTALLCIQKAEKKEARRVGLIRLRDQLIDLKHKKEVQQRWIAATMAARVRS